MWYRRVKRCDVERGEAKRGGVVHGVALCSEAVRRMEQKCTALKSAVV